MEVLIVIFFKNSVNIIIVMSESEVRWRKSKKQELRRFHLLLIKTPFASNQTIFTFRNLQFCYSACSKGNIWSWLAAFLSPFTKTTVSSSIYHPILTVVFHFFIFLLTVSPSCQKAFYLFWFWGSLNSKIQSFLNLFTL